MSKISYSTAAGHRVIVLVTVLMSKLSYSTAAGHRVSYNNSTTDV